MSAEITDEMTRLLFIALAKGNTAPLIWEYYQDGTLRRALDHAINGPSITAGSPTDALYRRGLGW